MTDDERAREIGAEAASPKGRPVEPFPPEIVEAYKRRGPSTPERLARFNALYAVALQFTLTDEDASFFACIRSAHQLAEYALLYAEMREAAPGLPGLPEPLRRG